MDIEATYKLLLMGDSGTGKSSILLRFIEDKFLGEDLQAATIGVDFKVKIIDLNSKRYKLTIWDTAGQERFRTLTSSYYRGAQGVILVYDVTNRNSFENLQSWFTELETYASSKDVVKMVIGNKIDKESERVVERKEGLAFAKKMSALFLECSAKTNVAIEQAFEELVLKVIETPSLWVKQTESSTSQTIQPSSPQQSDYLNGSCAC